MKITVFFSVLAISALVACSKDEMAKSTPEGQVGVAAPAGVPAAVVEPKGEPETALVTSVTSLKKEPDDAAKIDGAGGKKVNNWVATLYRGEQVGVVKVQEDWAQVTTSDESTGWMKKDGLLPSEGTTLATIFETVKTFNRPDLLTLNATRTLEAGSLLVVVKTKDQFSEVNFQGKQTAWVLSEKLNMDGTEIAAAKLVNKIRWLKAKKDPAADQFLELAKSQFSTSRLVGMFDEVVRPDGAAPEGAVPTDGAAAAPGPN
jgi:SH3-like domain-containing protein